MGVGDGGHLYRSEAPASNVVFGQPETRQNLHIVRAHARRKLGTSRTVPTDAAGCAIPSSLRSMGHLPNGPRACACGDATRLVGRQHRYDREALSASMGIRRVRAVIGGDRVANCAFKAP